MMQLGDTPLMRAAYKGHDVICTALIEGGADVNATSNVSFLRSWVRVPMQSRRLNGGFYSGGLGFRC